MQAPGIESADLSSMTVLSYGASPISEDLRKRASARFRSEFIQVYGMIEVCGPGTFLASADHDPGRGKLRSCGVALAGVELKIVAADGAEVQKGAVGEVVIRSPFRHQGLLEQTRRDGRLHPRRLDANRRRGVYGRGWIRLPL
jgi:acyl-CoA synthetase (AMP-forming)/AMP-acid ligase II